MDPVEIGPLPQLAAAVGQLRNGLLLRELADAAAKLPARGGRQPALPRTTASDLLNAKSVPGVDTMTTFLAVRGVSGRQAQHPWLQALDRVAHAYQQRPLGAVRVRDARPRLLGVHAAIQSNSPAGDVPAVAKLGALRRIQKKAGA
ncbi:hypothetical protein [Amycolatopsis sp. NPDC003861]